MVATATDLATIQIYTCADLHSAQLYRRTIADATSPYAADGGRFVEAYRRGQGLITIKADKPILSSNNADAYRITTSKLNDYLNLQDKFNTSAKIRQNVQAIQNGPKSAATTGSIKRANLIAQHWHNNELAPGHEAMPSWLAALVYGVSHVLIQHNIVAKPSLRYKVSPYPPLCTMIVDIVGNEILFWTDQLNDSESIISDTSNCMDKIIEVATIVSGRRLVL